MAVLPSAGSAEAIGIEIITSADNAGVDKAKAGIASVDEAAKASSTSAVNGAASFEKFNTSLKNVGQQMESTGRTMSTHLTVPILGIAAASTKLAMDFQQSMEMLHTNAGIPQNQIKSLGDSVLNMAAEVGQKPDDLAKAFYHIATAGNGIFSTSQMLDQLRIAAQGAAIGQANLDDTSYALTSTLAANVKGATDFNDTMGTLLGIVQAGDMHLSDLNEVIGTGLMGTLSTFGVSLQSAGAALADFGDLGEKGAAAGTRLRMMLSLMASPSAAAAKILGDLGLTTGEATTATQTMNEVFAKTGLTTTKLADDLRQPNGIYTAIMDLKTALEKSGMTASQVDTVLAKAFGGGRTDAALLQLLNTTDRLDLKYKQIGSDAGNFADNWGAQQQTMKQQWDNAWAGIQANMIKLGETIMPEVSKAAHGIADAVSGVTNWFEHLSDGQKQFVVDALAVVAVAGPVLMVFGSMAKSLSSILSLTSLVGNGVMGLAKGIGGLAGLGGEIGLGGELAAGAEASGGLMAALGPIGLGIGAVALAAGGAYLAIKHFHDEANKTTDEMQTKMDPKVKEFRDLAQNLGVTIHSTGSQVGLLDLAQTHLKDTQTMAIAAAKLHDQATDNLANSQKTASERATDLKNAQLEVNTALGKFGQNSPEYAAAVKNVADKQWDYDNALADTARKNVDLQIKTGWYHEALDNLNVAVGDASSLQQSLNSMMQGGLGVIAQFGPTAYNQVGSIAVLQQSISGVIASWSNAVANIQNQSPNVNSILFGTQSTIQRLQGQSDSLNSSLRAVNSSASMLQNAGGIQLQSGRPHLATGTNFARGGWTLVGEQGPEIVNLPRGSQVKTNSESGSKGKANSITVTIGTVILETQDAASQFFRQLNQDTMNLGKGLTVNQGLR